MDNFYKKYILIILLFIPMLVGAQKEANWWYFGNHAGLDFNKMVAGKPTAYDDGSIMTDEGCAAISNENGDLLFYSDGVSVWDRNHNLMPNGFGLFGNISSTQSAIIIPIPSTTNLFLIFTLDDNILSRNQYGLRYSLVNMNLNNGLGDIVASQKNFQLLNNSCERMTAVSKTGGGYWVIAQSSLSNQFNAFAITTNGVSTTSVNSNIGPAAIDIIQGMGQMKASPKGNKIAVAYVKPMAFGTGKIFMMDFNQSNGRLSNLILDTTSENYYGVEFSPDGTKLYCSANAVDIYQYDATSTNDSSFSSSAQPLTITGQPAGHIGSLQLGPDGKIYIAKVNDNQMNWIENPNASAAACNYNSNGPYLPSKGRTRHGLPNFITTFFKPQLYIVNDGCENEMVSVHVTDTSGIDSLIHNFGDPLSGKSNNSRHPLDSHKFSVPGKYKVQTILYSTNSFNKVIRDTLTDTLEIFPKPVFSLGNDTILCEPFSLILEPSIHFEFRNWNDGNTSKTIQISQAGSYWLTAGYAQCKATDTIEVSSKIVAKPNLGLDFDLCETESKTLSSNRNYGSYLWSNGSTNKSITIEKAGLYWMEGSFQSCSAKDSINVNMITKPIDLELEEAYFLCDGDSLELKTKSDKYIYNWSNDQTSNSIIVKEAGEYSLSLKLNECDFKLNTSVTKKYKPTIFIAGNADLCIERPVYLKAITTESLSVNWNNTLSDLDFLSTDISGWFIATATNACGSVKDSIEVIEKTCNCDLTMPNVFTPNGDEVNDVFSPIYSCRPIEYSLLVYNRWGQLMFESKDIENPWDGESKGNLAANGVYFYVVDAQFEGKQQQTLKGTFTLIGNP